MQEAKPAKRAFDGRRLHHSTWPRALCTAALLLTACEQGSGGQADDAHDGGSDAAHDDAGRAGDGGTWEDAATSDASLDGGEDAGTPDTDGGDAEAGGPDAATGDPCDAVSCDAGECDPTTGGCICPSGSFFDGTGCIATQACLADGSCDALCPIPRAPVLDVLQADEVLAFDVVGAALALQVGVASALDATAPASWTDGAALDLSSYAGQRVRVFARVAPGVCEAEAGFFSAIYDVRDSYPGAASAEGSTAIVKDDARLVAWADEADVSHGEGVDAQWMDANQALGPAEGTSTDVVVLGRGGQATLGFSEPIADGPGPDFAVFENSFSDDFLELGYVEVSSDGMVFVRFDSASLTASAVGAYASISPGDVHGFAGTYRQGHGSPFDLAWLRQHPAVQSGTLDLSAVTYVRIVDVVGDGSNLDSFGRAVYDPYPGSGAAGFDLDAVGVLQ